MKKLILSATVAFTVLTTSNIYAQQGFGTNTPDRSSAVDIVSNKRGLLIPRLELTKTTEAGPVVKPENALFVYNKASVNDVTPGFYYWEAANVANAKEQGLGRWVRFVSSNSGSAVTVSAGDNVTVKDTKIGHDTNYEVSVKGGTAPNQVLVTKKDGDNYITEWVNPEEFIIGVNGVTAEKVGDEVHVGLGGDLSKPTEIKTTKKNTLAISGLDKLDGTAGKEFDATSQNIVIMGTDGILKVVTPKALIDDAIDNGDIDGKALTSKGNSIQIDGTAAATALLKEVNIEVKGGDKAGQILVTKEVKDSSGTVTGTTTEWVDADKVGVEVTNGIQKITGADGTTKLGLGGALTEDKTSITTTDKNVLAIEGLTSVDKPVTDNNIVIADKDGVLKQTSAKNLIEDAVGKGGLVAKTLTTDGKIVIGDTQSSELKNAVLVDTKLSIKEGSITSTEILDGTIANIDLGNGAVTSDKMTAGVADKDGKIKNADKGMIPVAGDNGTVTYQQITGELLNGKALTSGSISVFGGETALLDATRIDITGGTNKGDVLVTTDKPLLNEKNEEVKDKDGKTIYITEWVKASDLGNTVKSGQGITVKSDNTVNLGGEITEPTILDLTGNGSLAITGLDKADAKQTNKAVVVQADGKLATIDKTPVGPINVQEGDVFVDQSVTNYHPSMEEIVIEVTLGATDTNLSLPAVNGTEGQTISVKIVNADEKHNGYLNIKSGSDVLAYGAMPFQGWIIKSNGTKWIVVGRN
ncbi:hypothetical protein [Myroides odoratimimus]|uniref:Uncharacterized protein n=1 Tax=Myroides odoratimimus CIP 101113 TaxID=883154 RepID=A0AAV3F0B2_9FLAO|nr:hypothetical protein [Myroides odoratimimus]EHO07702.1 hypothetical protein HMPREF9715_02875 [Myroides odoratimimus CIP 101113]